MSETLERLLQLCKENPDLAKVVEAFSIMSTLERSAFEASKGQDKQMVISRNTADISISFRDKLDQTIIV